MFTCVLLLLMVLCLAVSSLVVNLCTFSSEAMLGSEPLEQWLVLWPKWIKTAPVWKWLLVLCTSVCLMVALKWSGYQMTCCLLQGLGLALLGQTVECMRRLTATTYVLSNHVEGILQKADHSVEVMREQLTLMKGANPMTDTEEPLPSEMTEDD